MKPHLSLSNSILFFASLVFTSLVEGGEAKTQSDNKRLRVIITSDFPPIGVVKGGNVPDTMKRNVWLP